MKFKFDENLPADMGALLGADGHDAHSVLDENLRGAADTSVARACQDEQRILITLDLDFADITTYPPQDFHGIIVLRLAHQDRDAVLKIMPRILTLLQNGTHRAAALDCKRNPDPNQRRDLISGTTPYSSTFRSRSALVMSDTQLKLIASPPIIGFEQQAVSGYSAPVATGFAEQVVDEREAQVLPDVAHRRAAEMHRLRDRAQVALHERHAAALHRHVGAGPHRDAHVGQRQRRCVVDAVARHRDDVPRTPQ